MQSGSSVAALYERRFRVSPVIPSAVIDRRYRTALSAMGAISRPHFTCLARREGVGLVVC
jgi:hypothetical protein